MRLRRAYLTGDALSCWNCRSTVALAVKSAELGGLPEDPVDRLIIATALAQGAALMTADERLLGWGHALDRTMRECSQLTRRGIRHICGPCQPGLRLH